MFNAFRTTYNHQISWPPTTQQLSQFIAFLSLRHYSSSTVRSYLAAISYYCKISGIPDTTQSFVVQKTLSGLCRSKKQLDNRKPITKDILHRMLDRLPVVCPSHYEATLFSAIFTTAFFGYFRMGELVQNSRREVGHAIQIQDVKYSKSSDRIQIYLCHSKTDQEGKGAVINLIPTAMIMCPVQSLKAFIRVRPLQLGSFFCHADGTPVTRYQVMSVFSMLIADLGLDTQAYKTHSFRIGAATEAWVQGKGEDQIAKGGRWKSRCLYKYIRC